MKIAITSTGNNPNAMIDPRFGRCAYFAIYDTESKNLEFVENPSAEASSGAGPAAVQFIAKQKVSKVISGDFGNKILSLMEKLNITMQIENDLQQTINDIINQIKI